MQFNKASFISGFFKYNLQHLNKYCLAIDSGSNCPICPQVINSFIVKYNLLIDLLCMQFHS